MRAVQPLCLVVVVVVVVVVCVGPVAGWAGAGSSRVSKITPLSCSTKTNMTVGEQVAIESPNFPLNYPVDYRCQYEIACNERNATQLTFVCPWFNLESSTNCINDRFIVKYRVLPRKTHCGTNSPNGVVTTDGWMRVTFFSNSLTPVATGFSCTLICHNRT